MVNNKEILHIQGLDGQVQEAGTGKDCQKSLRKNLRRKRDLMLRTVGELELVLTGPNPTESEK